MARDTWIVCEGKQKYLVGIYAGAAATNVVLNFFFIKLWGASGAALASLITQISTIFVFPLLIKDYRPNVQLMAKGVLLRGFR